MPLSCHHPSYLLGCMCVFPKYVPTPSCTGEQSPKAMFFLRRVCQRLGSYPLCSLLYSLSTYFHKIYMEKGIINVWPIIKAL